MYPFLIWVPLPHSVDLFPLCSLGFVNCVSFCVPRISITCSKGWRIFYLSFPLFFFTCLCSLWFPMCGRTDCSLVVFSTLRAAGATCDGGRPSTPASSGPESLTGRLWAPSLRRGASDGRPCPSRSVTERAFLIKLNIVSYTRGIFPYFYFGFRFCLSVPIDPTPPGSFLLDSLLDRWTCKPKGPRTIGTTLTRDDFDHLDVSLPTLWTGRLGLTPYHRHGEDRPPGVDRYSHCLCCQCPVAFGVLLPLSPGPERSSSEDGRGVKGLWFWVSVVPLRPVQVVGYKTWSGLRRWIIEG